MPARVAASPVAASAAAPVVRVAARPAAYKVEESVRRVFSTFDRDGSGDLDVRELSKALQALGLETDREATRGVMAKYDTDGGGKLDLEVRFCGAKEGV
jgi:Ca2+-binding EF-hand superfamily protein